MMQTIRFIETPNGPIAVVETPRHLLADEISATRLRTRLSRTLGDIPVLLRCRTGSSFAFNGPPYLQRYAVDPMFDALPAVDICLRSSLEEAA